VLHKRVAPPALVCGKDDGLGDEVVESDRSEKTAAVGPHQGGSAERSVMLD
jgi:hypothetical protein